jgi:hypothetical protein
MTEVLVDVAEPVAVDRRCLGGERRLWCHEVIDPATEGVIGSVPDADAKAAGTAIWA